MRYRVGDKVFLKIKKINFVKASSIEYDALISLDVIGYDKDKVQYVLHVPCYYNVAHSWYIDNIHIEKYDLEPCYLDERGVFVYEDRIVRVELGNRSQDGMFCKKCNIFAQMAESNQYDGTFICYSCR